MSESLKNKAIELGIVNAEALTVPQLKKAIAAAYKSTDESDLPTEEDLVPATETSDLDAALLAMQAEMLVVLSAYLGVEDINELTVEQVKILLDKRLEDEAELASRVESLEANTTSQTDAASEIEVVAEEGKTDEVYTTSTGAEYAFSNHAPARFRYLGQMQTQEEWMADADAMDLMIAGKLSFLIKKK